MGSKGRGRGRTTSSTAAEQPTANAGSLPQAPMGAHLAVKDIEQASRFYQTLGFQQQFALPGADGKLTLAVLNFGDLGIARVLEELREVVRVGPALVRLGLVRMD